MMLTHKQNGKTPATAGTANKLRANAAKGQHPKVRELLHGPSIQPKLELGKPDDIYEQEADRVADKVMRMPESGQFGAQGSSAPFPPPGSIGQNEQTRRIIQHKADPGEDEEEPVQAKREGPPATVVTSGLSAGIRSLRGNGQPLSGPTRGFFETRFGADFSQVRVHTGVQSGELASSIKARAFTTGRDIFFAGGEYAPEINTGKRLLAHELAHVVQQSGPAGEGHYSPTLLQRSPDPDRQLALESAGCPRPSTGTTFAVAPGAYSQRDLVLPYDRVVPEPDPTHGVDETEVLRIIQEPDRLEQLYFDATHGNQRAAWLACQFEAGARSIGRQSSQHLNSLACLTVMSCSVHFERLPFSERTASGMRIRTVIGDAFVQESRRLQLRNEIIGQALDAADRCFHCPGCAGKGSGYGGTPCSRG